DVSDRFRAERALRESEERFRLVARATQDLVWDWNVVTGELWRNDALGTLLGYDEADVAPDLDWWRARVHPDDQDRVVGGLEAVVYGSGQFWSDEYRFRRVDGSWAHFF